MQKVKTKRSVATMFFITLVSVSLMMGLTACDNSAPPEAAPAAATTPAPAATPAPTPPEPAPTPAEPEADVSLVGAWRWADDQSFLYNFHADGTGIRGFELQGMVSFEWEMDDTDTTLSIATTSMLEEWAFAVVEEGGIFVLAIESLQVPGLVFTYMFTEYVEEVALEDYSILLGAWAWVDGFGNVQDWDYVFFSDGTGLRGTTENFDIFYWEANYATGELLIYIPSIFEEWDIELSADRFTASSPEFPGVRLIYNRIN